MYKVGCGFIVLIKQIFGGATMHLVTSDQWKVEYWLNVIDGEDNAALLSA